MNNKYKLFSSKSNKNLFCIHIFYHRFGKIRYKISQRPCTVFSRWTNHDVDTVGHAVSLKFTSMEEHFRPTGTESKILEGWRTMRMTLTLFIADLRNIVRSPVIIQRNKGSVGNEMRLILENADVIRKWTSSLGVFWGIVFQFSFWKKYYLSSKKSQTLFHREKIEGPRDTSLKDGSKPLTVKFPFEFFSFRIHPHFHASGSHVMTSAVKS